MARSGGFLADDDMTTDKPIALPLAFYRISQATHPSCLQMPLSRVCKCLVWGPLIAAGDHLWRTQDVRGDHL